MDNVSYLEVVVTVIAVIEAIRLLRESGFRIGR